jgi:RimJ/RimL family protein N-acetyltransferase
MRIRLRPAGVGDARLLWRLANDPATRRSSYTRGRIPWKTHRQWFRSKLSMRGVSRIYVAEDLRGRPVGQVRYDMTAPRTVEIDISVAPEARGQGIGTAMLRTGCRRAAADLSPARILAYVRLDNEASLALFRKAGFRRVRVLKRRGVRSVLFRYSP